MDDGIVHDQPTGVAPRLGGLGRRRSLSSVRDEDSDLPVHRSSKIPGRSIPKLGQNPWVLEPIGEHFHHFESGLGPRDPHETALIQLRSQPRMGSRQPLNERGPMLAIEWNLPPARLPLGGGPLRVTIGARDGTRGARFQVIPCRALHARPNRIRPPQSFDVGREVPGLR